MGVIKTHSHDYSWAMKNRNDDVYFTITLEVVFTLAIPSKDMSNYGLFVQVRYVNLCHAKCQYNKCFIAMLHDIVLSVYIYAITTNHK